MDTRGWKYFLDRKDIVICYNCIKGKNGFITEKIKKIKNIYVKEK